MAENGGNVLAQDGTNRDSTANESGLADHLLTTDVRPWNPRLDPEHDHLYDAAGRSWRDFARRSLEIIGPVAQIETCRKYPQSAYLYFIQASGGEIKIGSAADPHKRIKRLQTASPYPLKILVLVAGASYLERQYHKRFAAHRLHGEWFAPHPDILAEIERLTGHPQASNHSAGSSGAL